MIMVGQDTPRTDEAWLVVDKDNWTEDQLNQLLAWSNESEHHRLVERILENSPEAQI